MRYADSLLTDGETVMLRTRQHWLALAIRARAALLLWLAGIVLLGLVIYFNVQPGVLRDVISAVALIALVFGVLIFLLRSWQWWAQDYIVTNFRLMKVSGILSKRSADSSLEKINDAILNQSVWGRMFNYGDLDILTAAEEEVDRYHMLNSPKEFKKVMLTQKHELETGYMAGRPPTPPLRATPDQMASSDQMATPAPPPMMPPATPAPMAPPPPAAPDVAASTPDMAPSPPSDESLEVTETLARLADLRDKGAITPEEYEQKKSELLGRL